MPHNENGQPEGRPSPNCVVSHDTSDFKILPLDRQVSRICPPWGASLQEITHAPKRDTQGQAASASGAALDRIAKPAVLE
jgi:hypothetical protein